MSRYKGHRCIIPNCDSGYDSNNEKYHRFSVPFEKDTLLQWEKAIPRENFVLKGGMVVCHKHFLHEEIIWKREVKDAAGNVMASEELKKPHLKKGAVPSQFPNCPPFLSKTKRKRKSPKKRTLPSESVKPKSKKIKVEAESTKAQDDLLLQEYAIQKTEKTADSEVPADPELTERINLFNTLFVTEDGIKIPSSWCRRQCYKCFPCIELTQCTSRLVNGKIKFVTSKQITIFHDMRIGAEVSGVKFPLEKLGLFEVYISSLSELEMLIKKFENLKVFSGCASSESVRNVENSQ